MRLNIDPQTFVDSNQLIFLSVMGLIILYIYLFSWAIIVACLKNIYAPKKIRLHSSYEK